MQQSFNPRLSVAPMMDWTDRHCRVFHRQLSKRVLLYTEMVTAAALVRGRARHLLRFEASEHPVALQLGGADPGELGEAASMGAEEGYYEINLNVGCPSDRVQSGCFGAILMERPELVAECAAAMIEAQPRDVTVKCRIGVDAQDPAVVLPDFLARIQDAGVKRVIIHARKASLSGLSPKENREIPPLDYDLVRKMRSAFPDLHVTINGGIKTLDQAHAWLAEGMDGVMIGRAAYHTPADILLNADQQIYGDADASKGREFAALAMLPHIERHLSEGGRLLQVTRHMLGLFAGRPGARAWRRMLSEDASRPGADGRVVLEALERVAGKRAA
ncbi:MAG: tRNA dihydrouridine(20/20a) synthase DusA [Pseudomonadota bacterium]